MISVEVLNTLYYMRRSCSTHHIHRAIQRVLSMTKLAGEHVLFAQYETLHALS